MKTIDELLESLMNAIYGKDVRQTIHDAIKRCYEDATGNPDSVANFSSLLSAYGKRLDEDEAILKDIPSIFSNTNNCVRIGDIMIAFGNAYLKTDAGFSAEGNIYKASASFDQDVTNYSRKQQHEIEIVGAFPEAFAEKPKVVMVAAGSESPMWIGKVTADIAGLKDVTIYRPTSGGTYCNTAYIAVGRIDGSDATGAKVLSKGLPFVGLEKVGTDTLETYFLNRYAELMGETAQTETGWCSEFASVCAIEAGIPDTTFPRFKGGPNGSKFFSDIGCFYIRQGTGKNAKFVKATVTNNSKSGYAFTVASPTQEYTPKAGDVLWTCQQDTFSASDNYPSHTALVTSVERDTTDDSPYYRIYTLEGNLPVYQDGNNSSSDDALYRTVERRLRDIAGSKATGNKVYAIGRVSYTPTAETSEITVNVADVSVDGNTLIINTR